ncbi:MAG: PEP/pyruvate-binding domain-containing protein [Bdellovibrio sp.]
METLLSNENKTSENKSNNNKVSFQELKTANESELNLMGGKAATLARLLQKDFPVPQGAVLFSEPQSADEYQSIISWWENQGSFPVAVRSSASGEDSADFSYAGQFITLLNIDSKNKLVEAIKTCFGAVDKKNSQAYAAHFGRDEIPMHVLIQRMINSKFSGVFFSIDPRGQESSWLVEVVKGQGEQLVSGQVNPFRFTSDKSEGTVPSDWQSEHLQTILHWGQQIEKVFGYKADMEWAIDQEGTFWVLQSRPITAHGTLSVRQQIIENEWHRIQTEFHEDSIWDGHTFAEWTGVPTELTFDLWQKTFQKNKAFDLALKAIGYEGFHDKSDAHSLLDRIFGRAYLNLKAMEPIYFGEAPYHLEPQPRPHLVFDWKKLSPAMILRAPMGIMRMGLVAWNIQTGRDELCKKALELAKDGTYSEKNCSLLRSQYDGLDFEQSQMKLKEVVELFSQKTMQATFLITLLIEATTQGLLALLEKDLGLEKAAETISRLTGSGLHTVATDMHQALSSVEDSQEKWSAFIDKYGHRGLGELELSHARWIESSHPTFKFKGKLHSSIHFIESQIDSVLEEILPQLSAIRRPVFRQEWTELQKLMQVREEIKMEVMKPFAQIRWLVSAIGEKARIGSDIFWLNFNEIFTLKENQGTSFFEGVIHERREISQHLKSVDLPMLFSKKELHADLAGILKSDSQSGPAPEQTQGVSLAPGIASGIVHIVNDPEEEDLDLWPDNYVLVAEATDPGWTPLFEKAQAIIVARGGVLSHCAIVAREMNLPAVGEIRGANHLFKEGERVWVDGNNGTIRRSN